MNDNDAPPSATPRNVLHEAALFIGLGLISYALGAGIATISREVLGLHAEVAVAISLAVLILVNFWLNRLVVFRGQGRASHEFVKFIAASAVMRGFEYGVFLTLLRLAGLHYLAAYTTALILSNMLKFTVYRAIVFRRASEAAR